MPALDRWEELRARGDRGTGSGERTNWGGVGVGVQHIVDRLSECELHCGGRASQPVSHWNVPEGVRMVHVSLLLQRPAHGSSNPICTDFLFLPCVYVIHPTLEFIAVTWKHTQRFLIPMFVCLWSSLYSIFAHRHTIPILKFNSNNAFRNVSAKPPSRSRGEHSI